MDNRFEEYMSIICLLSSLIKWVVLLLLVPGLPSLFEDGHKSWQTNSHTLAALQTYGPFDDQESARVDKATGIFEIQTG